MDRGAWWAAVRGVTDVTDRLTLSLSAKGRVTQEE